MVDDPPWFGNLKKSGNQTVQDRSRWEKSCHFQNCSVWEAAREQHYVLLAWWGLFCKVEVVRRFMGFQVVGQVDDLSKRLALYSVQPGTKVIHTSSRIDSQLAASTYLLSSVRTPASFFSQAVGRRSSSSLWGAPGTVMDSATSRF